MTVAAVRKGWGTLLGPRPRSVLAPLGVTAPAVGGLTRIGRQLQRAWVGDRRRQVVEKPRTIVV
jgi:hypothetical protein